MKSIFQKIILTTILLALTGCTDAVCIDADDFGFSQVKVPASYSPDKIRGSGNGQYVDWYDSGLTVSGNDIHVVVKTWDLLRNINSADELSAWCAWLGPSSHPPSMQDICMMLDTCRFQNDQMCSSGQDANILNAPCIFKHGVGLYMLVAPPGFNPNASAYTNSNPVRASGEKAILRHLAEENLDSFGNQVRFFDLQIDPRNNSSNYVRTGGAIVKFTTSDSVNLTGGKLWFKILDKYYQDNSGQYIVTVKSGVTSTEWDPITFSVNLVKSFFFGSQAIDDNSTSFKEDGVIVRIFTRIVTNPGYKLLVNSLLSLAIIFYAINFLVGNIKITTQDLVIRICKILVISQLLTGAKAWSFFNEYLFGFFIHGSDGLIRIITEAGGTGPGPASIIGFMLAPHTIIKLFALPLLSWATFGWSFIYSFVYLLALGLVFYGLFYAAVIYILCLTMMGLIIALAPIFLCFLLFDHTRSLFDNWLRQLMSYAIQPLIVIAGVTMFGLMIKHQIYQTLGFRVCKYYWLSDALSPENALTDNIRGDKGRSAQPYFWKPVYSTNETPTRILLPEAQYVDSQGRSLDGYVARSNANTIFCPAYGCTGDRYPSFPFLDPAKSSDRTLLESYWDGKFAPFGSLAILLLSGLLITRFNATATKIAQYLTGGTFSVTEAASGTKSDIMKSTAQGMKAVGKGAKVSAKYGAMGAAKGGKAAGRLLKTGAGKLRDKMGITKGKKLFESGDSISSVKDKAGGSIGDMKPGKTED